MGSSPREDMDHKDWLFEEPMEWRLQGRPEVILAAVWRRVQSETIEDFTFHLKQAETPGGQHLRVDASNPNPKFGNGTIGYLQFNELPGERTRMRVPARGGLSNEYWEEGDAEAWNAFLRAILPELRSTGFLMAGSRFESQHVLDTALRNLASADESVSLAGVANNFRAALLSLANELYDPIMLEPGRKTPKGNDAAEKLAVVVDHHLAGRSDRYRQGVKASIRGGWDAVQPNVHRWERATKADLEVCAALVKATYEVCAAMVED